MLAEEKLNTLKISKPGLWHLTSSEPFNDSHFLFDTFQDDPPKSQDSLFQVNFLPLNCFSLPCQFHSRFWQTSGSQLMTHTVFLLQNFFLKYVTRFLPVALGISSCIVSSKWQNYLRSHLPLLRMEWVTLLHLLGTVPLRSFTQLIFIDHAWWVRHCFMTLSLEQWTKKTEAFTMEGFIIQWVGRRGKN